MLQIPRVPALPVVIGIMLCILTTMSAFGQKILVPMDLKQADHLKAYGIAYWTLTKNVQVDWLLNYRGGSFMIDGVELVSAECRIRGVTYELLTGSEASAIYAEVQSESNNMDAVRQEKAPKIAVYVPPNFLPWDDAVTLAMEYAEIPYEKIWDDAVMQNKLRDYDWVHLHHEDFTGQYGKFYANFSTQPWYVEQQVMYEKKARELGFESIGDEEGGRSKDQGIYRGRRIPLFHVLRNRHVRYRARRSGHGYLRIDVRRRPFRSKSAEKARLFPVSRVREFYPRDKPAAL
jgi:hypothetical protein